MPRTRSISPSDSSAVTSRAVAAEDAHERGAVCDLGELQVAILNVLWEGRGATVGEVQTALERPKRPAYTTVLTTLRNLERQGLVKHNIVDGARMYQYRAIVSRDSVRRQTVSVIADRLFGGSIGEFTRFLVTSPCLNRSDVQSIFRSLNPDIQTDS